MREHVEGQGAKQASKLKNRSETERAARLGKARAALAAALMRLAKAEKSRHHDRLSREEKF
jgi:hypothetical protein